MFLGPIPNPYELGLCALLLLCLLLGGFRVHQEASEGDVLCVVAVGPESLPLVTVEPNGVASLQLEHQALAL